MEVSDLMPLVEQLDDNIDDLEEAITPLLNQPLTEISKKLPVLDRAKLHVVTTYALESLIFSYLRLHGVDAKQHPIMRELTRVRQYFDKIQALETEPEQRKMTVDTQAASRFIKHGLAGNDKLDLERKEQEAKRKARAQIMAAALARKAETSGTPSTQSRNNEDEEADSSDSEEEQIIPGTTPTPDESGLALSQADEKKQKRKARREAKAAKQQRKRDKKALKESKKERRERKLEKRKAKKAKESTSNET